MVVSNETPTGDENRAKLIGQAASVAESRADRYALATGGAAAAQHGGAAVGLHARSKAMGLSAFAPVGLKCALWHGERCAPVFWKEWMPRRQEMQNISLSQEASGFQSALESR